MKYFLDSNFIIGLLHDNDSLHEKVKQLVASEKLANHELYISNLIINEVITILGNKVGVKTAVKAYAFLNSTAFNLIDEYNIKEFNFQTISNYEKYNKNHTNKLSFTDCSILTVMDYYNIDFLVSYDKQFNRCSNIHLINNI